MRDHTAPSSPDLAPGRREHPSGMVDDVLVQAVAVLRAFTVEDTHLTVDDIVNRSGLPSGAALEIVEPLSPQGFWIRPAPPTG